MLTALVLQLVQCLVSARDGSDGMELKVLYNICCLDWVVGYNCQCPLNTCYRSLYS